MSLSLSVSPLRSQTDSYDWQTWGYTVDTLKAASGQRIVLSSPFIQEGSERVYVNGKPLRKDQYVINYQRGLMMIKAPLSKGSSISVSYVRLPFLLGSVYALRKLNFSEYEGSVVVRRDGKAESRSPPLHPARNLVFGGMKSISFSVGTSKGLSLDQTLRATVTGNITPSIKVRALLSDNNLPVQPEGNTEELEYFDKVFVELSSDRAKATLGDFPFSNSFSTFSPFRREVKGIATEAVLKGATLIAAGASSKGIFRSLEFRGLEGLQGPYELLSPGRVKKEVILAGTEKVYLDGELLKRGQNRDYTIDYDRGTIEFTPRKLISADSEIAVDFEVTQEDFERTSAFASIETPSLVGGLKLRALFAREKDDPSRPKSVVLAEEERRVLADAGDDGLLAMMGGVSEVSPGEGEYTLVPEDTLSGIPEHYEFDDTTGSFLLLFIDVGPGRGDYALGGISQKGRPIYDYVGDHNGNYAIGKELPIPRSHELYVVRLARESGERVLFDLEYNLSSYDKNILSKLDDGDNFGEAGRVGIQVKKLPLRLGDLSLTGNVSTIDERFKSMDKIRPWYFYRDWNLEKEDIRGREILGEVTSSFARGESYHLDYSIGKISREGLSGMKNEARFRLREDAERTAEGRVFDTNLEGTSEKKTRKHETFSLSYGFWRLVPSIVYSRERYLENYSARGDSGIAYRLFRLRLSTRGKGKMYGAVGFQNRETEEISALESGWKKARRDRTFRVKLSSSAIAWVRGEFELMHRIEDHYLLGEKRSSDLARLKALVKLSKIDLRTDLDYEVSQSQSRTLQKNVIFVGEGKGDYNSLGDPVGKGRGDHALVSLPTTTLVPSHKVDFTLHTSWGKAAAGRRGGWGVFSWIRSNVSLDQTLSIKEETTFDPPWKVYLFIPSALQRDGNTLYGITSLRQDWSLLDGYKNLSLVIRYQRDDEEENRFEGSREERFFEQRLLRFDKSLSRSLSTGLELKREVRRRREEVPSQGTGSSYDVTGWSFLGGCGLRFSAGSTIDVELEGSKRRDRLSGTAQRALAFKPRSVLRLHKSLTFFGRYEFSRSWDRGGPGVKPLFFTSEGNSHRWILTANFKLSKMISLVSTYHGRIEDGYLGKRIIEHDLRMETRAYF